MNTDAAIPARTGWWKFDDPLHLLQGETGCPATLQLVGTHTSAIGPSEDNGAVTIGVGSYYKMQHNIAPNEGGNYVNEYSLLFDIKIPRLSVWYSFFQTNTANSNDGDFFINTSGSIGVGAVGYSGFTVKSEEWYRIIISVQNGYRFTCYLDGQVLMEGESQAVDGRFSLDPLLLIFADENGEDGEIGCSELAIWDQYLTEEQATALGGYGHEIGSVEMVRIPYLQSPATNSMTICWHDTIEATPILFYGTDSNPGLITHGVSEEIKYSYYWNTVTLEGLQPQTSYYYRISNGYDTSRTYVFRTLPDTTYNGIIRFIILGDTHSSDTIMPMKILRAARYKIESLYGSEIQENLQAVIHSGDIVVDGNSTDQYSLQYFLPLSYLSDNVATMVVAGNHEAESPYFYQYMKLDRYSAFPDQPSLNEKIWKLRVGNSLFLGLNTNIIAQYGTLEADWLDQQLEMAENNPFIDFVFLVFHHPPFSELWYQLLTLDGGPDFVENKLFPVIKKYTKVQQIHYGHTHGFERGTILSDKPDGDFRIICGGGSGGPLDPWESSANFDYPEIHKTFSEYFFQILEIDIGNHAYNNYVYSLGTLSNPKPIVLLDHWYKKLNQPPPDAPWIEEIINNPGTIQIHLSPYSGVDSLMSVHIQFIDEKNDSLLILDTLFHWQNIFGVDNNGLPIDRNRDIRLDNLVISIDMLPGERELLCRVRYRDHNLRWSDWSGYFSFETVGLADQKLNDPGSTDFIQSADKITYRITETSHVNLYVFDLRPIKVLTIEEGIKEKGTYDVIINTQSLQNGIYLTTMVTDYSVVTKKFIVW